MTGPRSLVHDDWSTDRRVFILGPSHHVPLSRCALSSAEVYKTPLYDLRIDQKVYADLWKTGMFERMSLQTDEDEHSIEMHLPYTAKVMESPLVVVSLQQFNHNGLIHAVSSEQLMLRCVCYLNSEAFIWAAISEGMGIIETLDPMSFTNYLKKYHNTICGRHPIGLLLNAVSELRKSGTEMNLSFLNYAQSSQCRNWQDSSVSYAAGALIVH
uniref:Protein MEMO1 n=1 Tax=Hucho hucho TaxID=62062 RepID=A0A4W5RUS8_9TELE